MIKRCKPYRQPFFPVPRSTKWEIRNRECFAGNKSFRPENVDQKGMPVRIPRMTMLKRLNHPLDGGRLWFSSVGDQFGQNGIVFHRNLKPGIDTQSFRIPGPDGSFM